MRSPYAQINKAIFDREVATVLHLDHTALFPLRTSCGLCDGIDCLTVFHDSLHSAPWLVCSRCQFSGNSLQFVTALWKLSPDAALARALQRSPDVAESLDLVELDDTATRVRTLLERTQAFVTTVPTEPISQRPVWHACRKQLGIPDAVHVNTRLKPFLRYTQSRELHSQFYDNALRLRDTSRTYASRWLLPRVGQLRTSDVLALPYADLPGRIRGFWILTYRKGAFVENFLRLPYEPFTALNRSIHSGAIEPGLGFLPSLFDRNRLHSGTVFCFSDPKLAARIHARHFHNHTRPVPVVASHHDKLGSSYGVWQNLGIPGARVVHWGEPSARLFAAAHMIDAKISLTWPRHEPVLAYLARHTVDGFLALLERNAEPWQEALYRYIADVETHQAEEAVLGIGLPLDALRDLIQQAPAAARRRIQGLYAAAPKTLVIANLPITERDGCWYYPKAMASNVILRIDRVIACPGTRLLYQGRVLCKDQEIAFVRSDKQMRDLSNVVRALCIQAGYPMPSIHRKMDMLSAALGFHPPVTLHAMPGAGWDALRGVFAFPQFTLLPGGSVEPAVPDLFTGTAAQTVPPPVPLGADDLTALAQDTPETAAIWGVLAFTAYNLLAPVLGQRHTKLAVTGSGSAAAVAAVGRVLSFELHNPSSGRLDTKVCLRSGDPTRTVPLRWPVMLASNYDGAELKSPREIKGLDKIQAAMAMGATAGAQAVALLRSDWCGFTAAVGTQTQATHATPRVLSAWLQNVCERKLQLHGSGPVDTRRILYDLETWWQTLNGTTAGLPSGVYQAFRIGGASEFSHAFAKILQELAAGGRLQPVNCATPGVFPGARAGIKQTFKICKPWLDHATAQVWLPKLALMQAAVLAFSVNMPSELELTEGLRNAGVLVGEQTITDYSCWSLPLAWWRGHQLPEVKPEVSNASDIGN